METANVLLKNPDPIKYLSHISIILNTKQEESSVINANKLTLKFETDELHDKDTGYSDTSKLEESHFSEVANDFILTDNQDDNEDIKEDVKQNLGVKKEDKAIEEKKPHSFNQRAKKNRRRRLEQYKSTCPCGAAFSRPSRLAAHALSHTGEKPFACGECEKCFSRNAHLSRHVKMHHQGLRAPLQQLSCKHCDGIFANKYSLKKHDQKAHVGISVTCSKCDKAFNQPLSVLKKRMRLKHGKGKYICVECNIDDEPSYPCKQCGKVCPTNGALRVHRSTYHIRKLKFINFNLKQK